MMMYEKQAEHSDIMLDFDIHLNAGGISPINHTHFQRLCLAVIKLLLKFVHFSDAEINQKKIYTWDLSKNPK